MTRMGFALFPALPAHASTVTAIDQTPRVPAGAI